MPVVDDNTTNELSSALVSNLSPLANPNGNIRAKKKQNSRTDVSNKKDFSSQTKCMEILTNDPDKISLKKIIVEMKQLNE